MRTPTTSLPRFAAPLANITTRGYVDEKAFTSGTHTRSLRQSIGLEEEALTAHEFAVRTKFLSETMAEFLIMKSVVGLDAVRLILSGARYPR